VTQVRSEFYLYTVNHKKRDILFLTITFLWFTVYINEAYHDALTGENEPIYRLLVSLSN